MNAFWALASVSTQSGCPRHVHWDKTPPQRPILPTEILLLETISFDLMVALFPCLPAGITACSPKICKEDASSSPRTITAQRNARD